jgi:CRP/FNR family cyclic AMP-dependent transcriptional regulator
MRTAKNGATLGPESETSPVGVKKLGTALDPAALLAKAHAGKTVVHLREKEDVFSQSDPADTVFYIQKGQVKLTVATQSSKGATISLLGAGDFIGEECITPEHPTRMATAIALTECTVLRVDRKEMLRVLHEEPAFSGLFVSYLLARSTQLEADLVE